MQRAIEITAFVILVAGAVSGVGRTQEYSTTQADSYYLDNQVSSISEDSIYSNNEYIYGEQYDVDMGAELYQSDYERYMGFNDNQVGYQFYVEDYNRYLSE